MNEYAHSCTFFLMEVNNCTLTVFVKLVENMCTLCRIENSETLNFDNLRYTKTTLFYIITIDNF